MKGLQNIFINLVCRCSVSFQIASRRDEASSHRQHTGQRKARGEMGQTPHHHQVGRKGRGLDAQPRFFHVSKSKSFAVTDEEGLMREAPLSPEAPQLSGGPGVRTALHQSCPCWSSTASPHASVKISGFTAPWGGRCRGSAWKRVQGQQEPIRICHCTEVTILLQEHGVPPL